MKVSDEFRLIQQVFFLKKKKEDRDQVSNLLIIKTDNKVYYIDLAKQICESY